MQEQRSLDVVLFREQARCRVILEIYKGIGAAGVFGATRTRNALRRSENAVANNDLVEMCASYNMLQAIVP
jgi:hypothetical protein